MDVIYIGEDDWSRKLYKSTKTGIIYAEVDGYLHTITSEGEPCSPICLVKSVHIQGDK